LGEGQDSAVADAKLCSEGNEILAAGRGMPSNLERFAHEPLTGLTAKSARVLLERLDDELTATQ
jgi:hypothetical protein